jgi:hypothetical protein
MMWWTLVARAQDPEVEQVLARFEHEPSVQQVQRWAAEHVEASPERLRRWLAAARRAAWLPEVAVDLRVRDDWDQGYVYLGVDGGAPAPGVALAVVAEDNGTTPAWGAKLSLRWRLDELVVSSNVVRLVGEARDLAELRDEVTAECTRMYFERRRLQVEVMLAPAASRDQGVQDAIRLAELTASLDALTGGAFSAAMDPHADAG